MKLEIRNLQSQATYEIDPEGAVLGREGSKADIVLRDQAVSKKHAKIYEKNGRWYLEDLASSNGTFVDNRRITEPVILTPGAVFALSENQFEVVQILNGANGKAAFESDSRDGYRQDNLDDLPPLGMMPGDDSQDGKRSSRSMKQSARGASPAMAGADPADDDVPPPEGDQKGVGYFFIAVPKAIAYYMAAIPLMAVNPVGTIRKSINEQRFPAMGPMQLIAYALPAQLFMQLVAVVTAFIVTLVAGSVMIPIVPLVTAVVVSIVVSVIVGFIFHPVFRWIINFLKGESDEKGRTNYFITMQTASALTAIPSALAAIIGLIPVPFINLLPVLITLVASLITFYAFYAWMKHFNVVNWFQKVLMVLGVLILLGAGANFVQALLASISSLGSGGGSVAAAGAVDTAGLTDEQKEALEKAQALAAGTGADAEAIKRAQEAAAKAMADAQAAAAKAAEEAAKSGNLTAEQQEAIKKAQEAAAEAAKNAQEAAEKQAAAAAKEAAEAAKKAQEAAEKQAAKEAGKKPVAAAEEEEEEEENGSGSSGSAVAAKLAAPPLPAGSSGFQDFLARRTAVETAIEKDPTILKRKDVRDAYERYLRKTYEVRGKWAKKKGKDAAAQKINERMKDIDVYESTTKMVSELYAKIYQ